MRKKVLDNDLAHTSNVTGLPLDEKASESTIVGMSRSVIEEKSTTLADTVSKSTSGMEVAATRGISPSVTEEKATSADKAAESTDEAEVVVERGISPSVTEERAITSVDTASQSTPGMKAVTAKGISPLMTAGRTTALADTGDQSTLEADIVETRRKAEKRSLGAEGNLDHLA